MSFKNVIFDIVIGYISFMSILGFAVMGIDKHRAKKGKWRIPERTLLIIACIGGGIGAFLGMQLYRHKTRHAKFVIILPLAAVLYCFIILKLVGAV